MQLSRLPKFRDLHPTFSVEGYVVTNEDPKVFQDLIADKVFQRSAGICSGGEMPLTVLLPQTSEEVIAIDQSYKALTAACLKATLIEVLGPTLAHQTLKNGVGLTQALQEKVVPHLPPSLAVHTAATIQVLDNNLFSIKREWGYIDEGLVVRVHANLEKLTFCHGDLHDLAPLGPFDCLYTSNAFDHTNRQGLPTSKEVGPLIKEGGLLLSTSGMTQWMKGHNVIMQGWVSLKVKNSLRAGWSHHVYTKVTSPPDLPANP